MVDTVKLVGVYSPLVIEMGELIANVGSIGAISELVNKSIHS